MSGPCTDCGGPDYQTLEARIAELEAERDALRAKWCGNCLSLETCYIAAKATELDDYEEQRVRCDFWAECEGGDG